MKSFRWTLVFAVVIVALAVFTLRDFKRSTVEDEQKQKDKSVVSVPIGAITHIEILSAVDKPLVLDRTGEIWSIKQPISDLADAQTMMAFLMSINGEKATDVVEEGTDLNLPTYGLDHPVKELKVGADARPAAADVPAEPAKSQDIKIGAVKAYDGHLYALVDGKRVDLVSSSWDAHLSKSPRDFRDKHLLRSLVNLADLKTIEIEQPGVDGGIVRLDRDEANKTVGWKLSEGGIDFPITKEHIEAFFDSLKGARALDFAAPDKTAPGLLAQDRLDHPNLVIRLFKTDPKPVFTAEFAPADPAIKSIPGHPPTVFAISSDLPDVLSVTQAIVTSVKKTAQDFYDRKSAIAFSLADVVRIEVQSPELKAAFKKVGQQWEVETPVPGKTVDNVKIAAAIERLSRTEPIRVLQPLAKTETPKELSAKDKVSKIILKKASGDVEFSFEWGPMITEKKTSGQGAKKTVVEAQYLPARTNRVDFLLGVTENEIKALDLPGWLSVPGPATTMAQPAAGSATMPKVINVPGPRER